MVVCFCIRDIGIACERARLPHLCGQPVALASAGGTVQVASAEAAAMGVRPELTVTAARSLCRGLTVLPYDLEAYREAAEAIWDLIALETDTVEPISPELCFCILHRTHVPIIPQQMAQNAAKCIGVPVTVGSGISKLVAEQAARGDFLMSMPIARLAMLDAKLRDQLKRLGIVTMADLRKIPKAEMERKFKKRIAYSIDRLLHGLDDDPVKALWPPPRIEHQVNFDEAIEHIDLLNKAFELCAAGIARELTTRGKYCRMVALTLQRENGSQIREAEKLLVPCNQAEALTRTAQRLYGRLGVQDPLTGILLTASDIDAGASTQLALLGNNGEDFPLERQTRLGGTMRTLRRRYGPGAVLSASLLHRAQPVRYWTCAVGKRCDESILVVTNDRDEPIRVTRKSRHGRAENTDYEVRSIVDRWRESGWSWGKTSDIDCFRIVTEANGTYELHKLGPEWRLRGVAD